MFLRIILSVFLFLAWGVSFNSICAAAPLMVEKNLFAMDRKPPPSESADASAETAKPAVEIGNIQLDGVIIESNAKRAILRMKNRPVGAHGSKVQPPSPFVTVREGQMVSDYRVSKIESKSISFEKDGQTFTVGLFAENKLSTPPSPAPAPPPVQQPTAPPGVAPQQAGVNQLPGVQLQPGLSTQNQPQQLLPGQAAPPPGPGDGRFPAVGGNIQQNVYPPVVNPDPNQPAEVIEQQE